MHTFKGDSDPDEELTISGAGSPNWTGVSQKNRRRKIDAQRLPNKSLQACALKEHASV